MAQRDMQVAEGACVKGHKRDIKGGMCLGTWKGHRCDMQGDMQRGMERAQCGTWKGTSQWHGKGTSGMFMGA